LSDSLAAQAAGMATIRRVLCDIGQPVAPPETTLPSAPKNPQRPVIWANWPAHIAFGG